MIIYITRNKINKKFYIGQDSKNNPNYYGSGKLIKQAIKKYGKENFEKITLEKCASKIELNEREIYWIKELNATNLEIGYNLAPGGGGFSIYDLPKKIQIKWKINNKIAGKYASKRKKSGNFTESEINGHKKLGIKNSERIKKFGLSSAEIKGHKNGAIKISKTRIDRIKKFGLTLAEIEGHKKTGIKCLGPKSYNWKGYIYIYNNNKLINRIISFKFAFKFLNTSKRTLKKILNEKYLDIKKYSRLSNKLKKLDGYKFFQSKEILN